MEWDQILGISTVIIAITALVFTYCQIQILKKHNRLSVKPHLCINYIAESEETGQCFELVNNGIGPAIIKLFTIFVNGKPFEINTTDDAIKVFKGLGINEEFVKLNLLEKDDALKVGYVKPLISIQNKYRNSVEVNSDFRKGIFKIGFEIKYKSIYEEEEFTLTREPIIPPTE